MAPEVLIVGDGSRRADLVERLQALGYAASVCSSDDLAQRIEQGKVPAAVVVCTEDDDPRQLMTALRSTRQGSGVPVTLYGPLGGRIGDLVDVLDLGADHFLEEPADDEQLATAIADLAGPGASPMGPPPSPEPTPAPADSEPPPAEPGSTEGVLGQLHRTLDKLEARLREHGDGDSDDLDLAELGFAELPDTGESIPVEPSRGSSIELYLSRGEAGTTTASVPAPSVRHESSGIREPTERLGHVQTRAESADPGDAEAEFGLSEDRSRGDRTGGDRAGGDRVGGDRASGDRAGGARLDGDRADEDRADGNRAGGDRADGDRADGDRASGDRAGGDQAGGDRPRRRPPLPIETHGSLHRVEVPRLLWRLHRAGYTGALLIEQGRVHKRLWWREGDIVFVRSNVGHDRLVDGLLRRGLLTREQYDTARGLADEEPGRLGARLVEAGFIKATELPRVFRNHLTRIIDSTFPWSDGHWTLLPDERVEEAALIDTPVALIVAEGIRHRMESSQLTALLGGLDRFPRFRIEGVVDGTRALAERLMLTPSEEAWLTRLDGSQLLRELRDDPRVDELELLGLVYMLHVLEHLELRAEGAADSDAAPGSVDRARIRDRLQLAREGDYFAMLGLSRDAGRLDVRRAHAQLRQTFADEHLEADTLVSLARELDELRELLDEARDVLMDEGLRSAYLAHLEDP